jgi:DNA-directed RNA polymerase subunit RPC12/RpoP
MSHWDTGETDEAQCNVCVWCGASLESPKYSAGARICWECAMPGTPHRYVSDGAKQPTCIRCGREFNDPLHRTEETRHGRTDPDAA